MKQGVGQAFRHGGNVFRHLLRLVLTVVVVVLVAAGGLAWRLSERPLELDWLIPRLERVAAGHLHRQLTIGGVSLGWQGFRQGLDSPLEIHLAEVVLRDESAGDGAGGLSAEVPEAVVSLSAGELAWGRIVPRVLELDGLRLLAERGADGSVRIGVGGEASRGGGDAGLQAVFGALARPAGNDREASSSMLAQLSSVRLRDAGLEVRDLLLGLTWKAQSVELDLARGAPGGVRGTGGLTLDLGNQSVRATIEASLPAGGDRLALEGRISAFNPAGAASLAPPLAPLKALDAPLTLSGSASLGPDLVPSDVAITAHIGTGHVTVGALPIPLAAADLEFRGTLQAGALHIARLVLAPRGAAAPTTVAADIKASREDGKIAADLSLDIDQIAFADLAQVWPASIGGPGLQPWITGNITGGTARNARVALHLVAPEDFSDADVTAITGGLDGEDMTTSWLKPVPPLEHATARLDFLSPQALQIAVSGARQAGGHQGGLVVQNGMIRITGLDVHDQFLNIDADITGPAADLVTLLRHPRLHLLDRRPVNIQDPSGTLQAHLSVLQLPLKNDLSVDELRIRSSGRLTRLHLTGIAAGADLDRASVEYSVDNDGMKLHGSGDLGHIPSQFQAELDFRDGPASQVLQKVTLTAKPRAAQLAALGLKGGDLFGPEPFPVTLTATTRRDDRGEIAVRADLRDVGLVVADLNFRKPAGQAARAEIHLQTEHDRISALDSFGVEGEGIAVSGSLRFHDGQPAALHLARLKLGDATDLAGDVAFPAREGAPWSARLEGRSIDATSQIAPSSPADADAPARRGPPWRLQANFNRVVLGPNGRALHAVSVDAASDGEIVNHGVFTGKTDASASFHAAIEPRDGERRLSIDTEDAGGLLRALGVVDEMHGGKLVIEGSYDDKTAAHPLQGRADITDFRVQNAPALAKLLQIMTFYGLADVLRGPGMGFSRMVVPFRKTGDALEITDARAFSPSLGLTAKGRIDLARARLSLEGTIVPAYFFNTLLGQIPLVGRIFSPEEGGGVFAATYTMSGPLADPSVSVNPLAALTPGFLRGLFGIFDTATPAGK